MSTPVTAQFLLEGTVYALQQCGFHLRDANILYRGASYANALVLAAFAREELGRSNILFDLRTQLLAGTMLTLDDINTRCEDHITKQQSAVLSTMLQAETNSGLQRLLKSYQNADPQTQEGKDANDELTRIVEIKRKRASTDRHKQRLLALYVQPDDTGSRWNRPIDISQITAREFLHDAANDYARDYNHQYVVPGAPSNHIEPELFEALKNWSDRPELPLPEWPH
jgi:AbiV family abortive infection protein